MMVYLQAMRGMGKRASVCGPPIRGLPLTGSSSSGYAEGGISGDGNNSAAAFPPDYPGVMEHPVASMVNNPLGQSYPASAAAGGRHEPAHRMAGERLLRQLHGDAV